METRNARMFEVEEVTELSDDGPVEVSAPTVVVSAAPLMTVVESSAPTRREIPVARLPGKPMGATRVERRAQTWTAPTVFETAPVGRIPMPGERPSVVLPMPGERANAGIGVIPMLGERANAGIGVIPMLSERPSVDVVTIVHQLRRASPEAARAGERRAEYVVGGDAVRKPRVEAPVRRESRGGLALVAIIGLLAGLVVVLSVVVVRQQIELRENRVDARRAANAREAYAAEVMQLRAELARR